MWQIFSPKIPLLCFPPEEGHKDLDDPNDIKKFGDPESQIQMRSYGVKLFATLTPKFPKCLEVSAILSPNYPYKFRRFDGKIPRSFPDFFKNVIVGQPFGWRLSQFIPLSHFVIQEQREAVMPIWHLTATKIWVPRRSIGGGVTSGQYGYVCVPWNYQVVGRSHIWYYPDYTPSPAFFPCQNEWNGLF